MTETRRETAVGPTAPGRTLVVNATLSFVIAAMVNDLLHESAHAVAGLAQGLVPTISSFAVEFVNDGTARQQIVCAAAGPVFSLVQGLVLMLAARNWGTGIIRMFWTWLAFMGVMNFVGYCFIAPFARAGDTGQVLALLGAPGWVFLLVAAAGVGGQFLLARRFAVEVKRYTRGKQEERRFAYFSWLLGTPFIVVLSLLELLLLRIPGRYVVLILAYSVAFGIFAPMQFLFSDKVENRYERLDLRPRNWAAVVVTAALVALNLGICAAGGIRL